MPVHIPVKQIYSRYDISVQFGYMEDGEFVLEECNHNGCEQEEFYDTFGEGEQLMRVLVCDKQNCKKQYNELDESWQ